MHADSDATFHDFATYREAAKELRPLVMSEQPQEHGIGTKLPKRIRK